MLQGVLKKDKYYRGKLFKQFLIIVILPPKEKKAYLQPSSLLDTFSMIGAQKFFLLGLRPKGRPKQVIGNSTTSQPAKLAKYLKALFSMLMLVMFDFAKSTLRLGAHFAPSFALGDVFSFWNAFIITLDFYHIMLNFR